MKPLVKKCLLCGGTLLTLGIVSAGLLSGVNLLTSPIIANNNDAKANGAYLEIFPNASFSQKQDFSSEEDAKALSEAGLSLSTVDYYVTAYEDSGMSKELGKVFHGQTAGRDATLELLVGFSMQNGSPTLVKIAMVQCNDSFKSKFEDNYLNPVNAGSRNYEDVAGVGATVTSTAVKNVVSEAAKLFSAISGGVVEDPSSWMKGLFEGKGYKLSSSSVSISGNDAFSKYYSYYDDALGHNEAGRFYVGKVNDFSAAIAVSASGFEGGYILSSSFTDVDYKASPCYSASSLPSGDTGAALSSLGEQALALLEGNPLNTLEAQAAAMYEGGASAKKSSLNLALTGVANLGIDTYSWPAEEKKQEIYSSYEVYDASGSTLGVVYEAEFHIVKDEQGSDESEAHGGLYFLLGFSGEDYDNPTLTNVVALENSFSKASVLQKYCIDVFNKGADHSWSAFKTACAAEIKVDTADIGATISSHGLYEVANLERQQYSLLKKGGE